MSGPRVVGPLLGLVLAWTGAATWAGLVLDPRGFLQPAALGGLAVVAVGVGLRGLRLPAYAVATAQLLVAGLALHTAYVATLPAAAGGLLPGPGSVRALVAALEQGAVVLGTDVSPVDRGLAGVHLVLLGCALLLVWGVDVLAQSLRRAPLAGLPVLAAVSVPVTVLVQPVGIGLFVVMATSYVLLLASDRGGRRRGAVSVDAASPWRDGVSDGLFAAQVAVVSALVAVLVAPLVPLADPYLPGGGADGGTDGDGAQLQMTGQNPFVSLRRQLLEQTDTPMVYARTESAETSYLRSVVLDSFTEDSWSASDRDLPPENSADGVMPAPPGLSAGTGGVESRWELQLDRSFGTRWLPLPSPLREIEVDERWRYDERFLDVALPAGDVEPGLTYRATAFRPAITAGALDRAVTPPDSVLEPMTELPEEEEMPPEIGETARAVTAGAQTPYQQAVALQDWFRQDGGFEYSLEERPGSGLRLLADFVTTDRVGYCEQFAAAMAAMGRTLGIPSRVAVGFLGPERLGDGRLLYTSDARHAWPEMYFSGVGWVRFEPTPSSRTGASPDYTRQSVDAESPSATPTAATPPAPRSRSANAPDAEQGTETSGPDAGLLWWGLLALLVTGAAAPALLRRRQRAVHLGGTPGEGAWAELRAVALDTGVGWDDDRSPREQARALVREVRGSGPDDVEVLEALLRLVERGRFARPLGPPGPPGPSGPPGDGGVATLVRSDLESERDVAIGAVQRWSTLLQAQARVDRPGVVHRARRTLLPASVLRRRA